MNQLIPLTDYNNKTAEVYEPFLKGEWYKSKIPIVDFKIKRVKIRLKAKIEYNNTMRKLIEQQKSAVGYYYLYEKIVELINSMIIIKPNFTKRCIKIKTAMYSKEMVKSIQIEESFWIVCKNLNLLKGWNDFDIIFIDNLFKETEYNKGKKKAEVEALYKKICEPIIKEGLKNG